MSKNNIIVTPKMAILGLIAALVSSPLSGYFGGGLIGGVFWGIGIVVILVIEGIIILIYDFLKKKRIIT